MNRGFVLSLLVLPLVFALSGCSDRRPGDPSAGSAAATPAQAPPRVQVAVATTRGTRDASFTTFLEAEREAEIVAETDGAVTSVRVREGRRVAPGDTLLVLDDRDERLAVRRDEAEVAWSKAQLARMEALVGPGHVSAQEVDQARLQLDRAQAALGISRVALSRCAVRSPIAGLVWMIRVEPLHRVTVGQPLLRVTNPERLRASAYLPGSMRGQIRPGTRVRLEPTLGGPPIEAQVSRVDPLTDPASGTFRVVATFRRRASHPEAGAEVRFVVPGPAGESVLLVPVTTIVESNGESSWIWCCEGGRARRCSVRLGAVRGDAIEVESGLRNGARVVVGSDRPLQDGQPVEMVEAR
jgi:membrane fusion protein, multidrug efflux system